jgi:hypothetical protein
MHKRSLPGFSALLLSALLAGCELEIASEPAASRASGELATAFDPAQTGTIRGTIKWEGKLPELPPLHFFATPTLPSSSHPHPNVPDLDTESNGLCQAVVFLRGVDPSRSRPWDHEPVHVEIYRRELTLLQKRQSVSTAFVRRGADISLVSRDSEYHCLRGRGAAFFAQPFPDADVTVRHRLDQRGDVVLTSAAGFYWMRAHLLVDDHPYYARTDTNGEFVLEQVPAGEYELVSWLPSWVLLDRERDPETGGVTRLVLAPPCEQRQRVRVEMGGTSSASFTWSCERVKAVKR